MSKRETYEARTEELITPILERMHFELVDVEYVKEGGTWYLRAYIDKEGGITVNDCEAVAREMNEILDREDFVEDSYVFEVSSRDLADRSRKKKIMSGAWERRLRSALTVQSTGKRNFMVFYLHMMKVL